MRDAGSGGENADHVGTLQALDDVGLGDRGQELDVERLPIGQSFRGESFFLVESA